MKKKKERKACISKKERKKRNYRKKGKNMNDHMISKNNKINNLTNTFNISYPISTTLSISFKWKIIFLFTRFFLKI